MLKNEAAGGTASNRDTRILIIDDDNHKPLRKEEALQTIRHILAAPPEQVARIGVRLWQSKKSPTTTLTFQSPVIP